MEVCLIKEIREKRNWAIENKNGKEQEDQKFLNK